MAERVEHPGAGPFLPESVVDLGDLAEAAQKCRGCDLYANATQAVFGQGSTQARLILIGEQPGDVEDRQGAPFVGPAGRVLDEALAQAGLSRNDVYLTNAVKHFRWKPATRGKRRIHERPTTGQIVACRPWLDAELAAVEAEVVVAMGATAVTALFGKSERLATARGRELKLGTRPAIATIHPSAVLREPDAVRRAEVYRGLVEDLVTARTLLPAA